MAGLGYAGLSPFLACALLSWMPSPVVVAWAGKLFVVYGVVILSFLGGTLWGNAAMRPKPEKLQRLVLSNIIALLAALAGLLSSVVLAAVLLALGQCSLLLYERSTGDANGWYLRLRSRLTGLVLPLHLLFVLGQLRLV